MRISDWSSDVCSSDLQRALFVRNGDVFVRELGAGVLRQLTASAETEADPQFSADQQAALWRVGNDWYRLTFSEGVARAVALPRAEKDPQAEPAADALRADQLRRNRTLAAEHEHSKAEPDRDKALRQPEPTRAAGARN